MQSLFFDSLHPFHEISQLVLRWVTIHIPFHPFHQIVTKSVLQNNTLPAELVWYVIAAICVEPILHVDQFNMHNTHTHTDTHMYNTHTCTCSTHTSTNKRTRIHRLCLPLGQTESEHVSESWPHPCSCNTLPHPENVPCRTPMPDKFQRGFLLWFAF